MRTIIPKLIQNIGITLITTTDTRLVKKVLITIDIVMIIWQQR